VKDGQGLLRDAAASVRANLGPGVLLWVVAMAVVGSFFWWPAARPAFETVAGWKATGGFLYSFVATAVFAGLIPWLVTRVLPASRAQSTWSGLVFLLVFWGYRGIEIDLFYQLQSALFGTEGTWQTITVKVMVDMLVYNVVWAASLQLIAYRWKNGGFRSTAFRDFTWKRHFSHDFPIAVLSTWLVWIPVVALTYSLPPDLQIPVFNLAACFWSLVVSTLTLPTTKKRLKMDS